MAVLQVYDPAMCCSTGVCGPSVDPDLARFAADLEWFASRGVSVERFNLSQEPGRFTENEAVHKLLEISGEAALPVVIVDGEVRSLGHYPNGDEIATWVGIAETTDTTSDTVAGNASCCSSGPANRIAMTIDSRGCC
ncbi:MAG: arsenite efflux transporter metallochaperone ArsD [Acidimicrobiales bacterium]